MLRLVIKQVFEFKPSFPPSILGLKTGVICVFHYKQQVYFLISKLIRDTAFPIANNPLLGKSSKKTTLENLRWFAIKSISIHYCIVIA